MAHRLMCITHTDTHTQMQMDPCKDSTLSAERSQHKVSKKKKIFEDYTLPVAMERSSRRTYSQIHTPTHSALSILKKQSYGHEHEPIHMLNQSLSYYRELLQLFKRITS